MRYLLLILLTIAGWLQAGSMNHKDQRLSEMLVAMADPMGYKPNIFGGIDPVLLFDIANCASYIKWSREDVMNEGFHARYSMHAGERLTLVRRTLMEQTDEVFFDESNYGRIAAYYDRTQGAAYGG